MFYGVDLTSRLMLGTAQYPSPAVLRDAIAASGTEVITVSLRREGPDGAAFARLLADCGCQIFDYHVIRSIWLTRGVLYYS